MANPSSSSHPTLAAHRVRRGISQIEFIAGALLIGVITLFGGPQLQQLTERRHAAKAFDYLSEIQDAQDKFKQHHGAFATDLADLDMTQTPPTHFDHPSHFLPESGQDLTTSWQLTLNRVNTVTSVGVYRVTFNQDGYDQTQSNVPAMIAPQK